MAKLQVFVVDDHPILRAGLKGLIDMQHDMSVVGEAADGAQAVEAVRNLPLDIVVMDISMPVLGGREATALIRTARPDVRVLALTAHEDAEYVRLLLEAGASGYVLKRAAAADLVRAIRAVAAGQLHLDTTTWHADLSTPPPPAAVERRALAVTLSQRESDVLRMIALGYPMKKIATALAVSPRTLETYKARAMAKLELENRADIVRFALQEGWLHDG